MTKIPKHRIYEIVTADLLKKLDPNANVKHNVQIPVIGNSDRTRQVDVYIEGKISGMPMNIVVDCKHHEKAKDKSDVKELDSFLGMVDDLKPNLGVLVSIRGFTSGAIDRAKKEGNRINLCTIFDGENLEYSTPLNLTVYKTEKNKLQQRIRFSNGSGKEVSLNLPNDYKEWEVIDNNKNRFNLLNLAVKKMESDSQYIFEESGTIEFDPQEFKIVNGNDLLTVGFLKVEFRIQVKCFKKKLNFVSGTAVLDQDQKVLSQNNLTTEWTHVDDGWEEISLDEAKRTAANRTYKQ